MAYLHPILEILKSSYQHNIYRIRLATWIMSTLKISNTLGLLRTTLEMSRWNQWYQTLSVHVCSCTISGIFFPNSKTLFCNLRVSLLLWKSYAYSRISTTYEGWTSSKITLVVNDWSFQKKEHQRYPSKEVEDILTWYQSLLRPFENILMS